MEAISAYAFQFGPVRERKSALHFRPIMMESRVETADLCERRLKTPQGVNSTQTRWLMIRCQRNQGFQINPHLVVNQHRGTEANPSMNHPVARRNDLK